MLEMGLLNLCLQTSRSCYSKNNADLCKISINQSIDQSINHVFTKCRSESSFIQFLSSSFYFHAC